MEDLIPQSSFSVRRASFMALILLLLSGPALFAQVELGQDSNSVEYSYPREYVLAEPTFEGISTLDEKSLLTRTGLKGGQTITIPGDDISNAIRNLWKLRLFSDVQIEITRITGNTVFLNIVVKENPRMSKFSLTGTRKSENDDIRERIKLVRGTPVKDDLIQDVKNKITDYYADKGFLACNVDVLKRQDTIGTNNVILDIRVNKGARVKINEITFIGNDSLSDRRLRKQMKGTKERFRFDPFPEDAEHPIGWDILKPSNLIAAVSNMSYGRAMELGEERFRLNVFSSSKYSEEDYDVDRNMVIRHYNTRGYRDARVVRDSVYLVDEKSMAIDIWVDEGPQYYFRDITWKGNVKYTGRQNADDPPGRLDSVLTIRKGDLYNAERLEQKLRFDPTGVDVSALYLDDGYLFFSLTPVEVLVEGDSIDLEIRIQEGPQARIRNVIIKGNTRTNERVVRRELRTRPGDQFSRADLIRSQREIASLPFFDPEQIGAVPIPNPEDGSVDIEYTVVERPSDQLELSAGWGGVGRGVIGSVGVSFNNFSVGNMFKKGAWAPLPQGDGQTLSFRVNTNGRLFQSYNMSFTEPWLGGKKPNSFTFSVFRTLLSNGLARNEDLRQSFGTNGLTLAYGIRLKWPDDFFTFLTSINLQNYTLKDWNRNNFFLQNGNIYNFSTTFTLARNNTGNNPFFPKYGSNISLSLQVTPPYSSFQPGRDFAALDPEDRFKWIEYHKWRFNAQWYTSLDRKGPNDKGFVLKAQAKLGFIGFYKDEIGHSGFEQFQLGGDGLTNFTIEGFDVISLRGYDPFALTSGGNPINSPIFNKFTLELRYPISLNPSSTVYALAFAEGGNLYTDARDYNPFNLNRSVGVGVRAFLPMFGLLGIDYGIRFDETASSPITESQGVFDYILNNGAFNIILGFEPE